MEEHNFGKVSSIRAKRPLKLIGYKAYNYKKGAENREKYLKSNDRKKERKKRFIQSLKEV
jgi:predicted GIY-YIG superfamily endonuclease